MIGFRRAAVTRRLVVAVGMGCALCGWSAPALAQPTPPPSRFELGIGAIWIGGQPLGTTSAAETTASGSPSVLFRASSELGGAAGIEGRVGVRLSRSLTAEVETSYVKPQLRVAISGDTEGAPGVTAVETMQQFTIGGQVLWYLPGRRWSARFAPFVAAGGGYLRQLHEQATLVETGRFYQFGGGVSARLATRRHFHTKGVGIRADVHALIRADGVAFDGGSKASPAAAASLFVRF